MGVEIDLSGRAVLVTGGTRGIGAGIAEVLLRAGAQVLATLWPSETIPRTPSRTADWLEVALARASLLEARSS